MSQKKKISLKELDFNNIGGWPRQAKIGFCVIMGLLIVFLAYWLFVRDKRDELANLERKESQLRSEFEEKQGRAANLEPLKQQLAQMEQVLQQMLRQLPSKTEMPDLIVDISQTALATGLQNELFQPEPEVPKEFYAEKPISLRMIGSYHQFGAFVSGVASLPRVVIMTFHNISLKPRGKGKDAAITATSDGLELAGTVKTYRYLDDEETAQLQAADAAADKSKAGKKTPKPAAAPAKGGQR
ncbi:type 4a pilus biogenesis protein PilO [Luteimonas sp. SX5]|uniref:Type 4a pilus biogenesis protein PilO n=1 Tax=Luteimonas galliterrae TaxID=2940486 RepID=A0ABT0MKM1_9GAMM|nr:type 4a pilus biogenesis protein PilO [Luteimonas galliterrae]MCL1635420.1 type 4a pilus biogenesis protein PilO [Luteimonas galliterrae]